MVSFCAFHWLCMISGTRFTFIVERSWKNMYFRPKLAWPPAIDNAISRNHSNWPSPNLSQNLREVWANSYWKRQVLMFFPLGKNSEKPKGDVIPPPLYVRGLKVCKTIRRFSLWWQLTFFYYANMHQPYHSVIDDLFCLNVLLAIETFRKKWMKTEE